MLTRFGRKFGVQSKFLALVLFASLASLLLTGFVSFGIARHLLTEAGYNQLIGLRNARAEAVQDYFRKLDDHVLTMSEAQMTVTAVKEFSPAYSQLPDINPAQRKELEEFYLKDFLPKLKKNISGDPRLPTYFPPSAPARYLKYHYVSSNPHRSRPAHLDDAGDGSQWSTIHRKFHPRFRRIAERYGYQDILLVDIKTGDVVYSVANEIDLGTNLLNGPFSDSAAAQVFREVKKSRDPLFITQSDLEHYKPGLGVPTRFAGTTVFDGDNFIGALLFQLDYRALDRTMTSNRRWSDVGLGKTGETYLVGRDSLLRSSPRGFLENPGDFLKLLRKRGYPAERIAQIETSGTPLLIQEVRTEGVRRALEGKTGTAAYVDYRGVPVIGAYQPIRLGPFQWVLLAEIDQAELFAGVQHLARVLLLVGALLIPLLTLLALTLARSFVRPIRRLMSATDEVAAGHTDVQVSVTSEDEFGELSTSFNKMADQLASRERSIQSQLAENDRLLLSILPAKTAERLKRGEKTIADSHPSVTVLFAEIDGLNVLSQQSAPENTIVLLNELIGAFDEAAERLGMEKLRSVGSSYLAVCGLTVPRVDHERRALDFGLEMLRITARLNQKRSVALALAVGIHSGSVSAGVVGSSRFYYDVWGETITIARAIGAGAPQDVILVSEPVVVALSGLYAFDRMSPVTVKGQGELPVWQVKPPPQAPANAAEGDGAGAEPSPSLSMDGTSS
ncbi:HAMP domain-containing protein [Cyanobium sp. FGCU-6]|nr:HAMP domain-containing protein [Cyanobium sp. FGCU6]